MTSANVAIAEALVASMQAGDLEAVLARLHPDVEVHEPDSLPYGGVFRGRDAFQNDLLGTLLGLAELVIEQATIRDAGDRIVILMEVALTSRATGRTLYTSIVEIDEIADGLIHRIDVYYKDTKQLVEFYAER